MSREMKIVRNIGIGVAALIVLVLLAALIMVNTSWFRETARRKIIALTEESTGGRVTLGSFDFSVSHLRATVTDFVIHGKEPPGAAPFLRVARAQVDVRLFTSLKHIVDISYLGVDQPQVDVIVMPDGTTNIPSPKAPSNSNESALATVVDLAIGRFDLSNGLIDLSDRKQPIDVHGRNLRAVLNWSVLKQSYQGQLSMEPLYVISGRNTPVTFQLTLPVVLERDRVLMQNARIATAQSSLTINASIENMKDPRTSAHINGYVSLADAESLANLPLDLKARNVPKTLDLDANATISSDTIQVTGLRLTAGQSNIEASGTLRNPQNNGALEFKSTLDLSQLGRLAKLSARPTGEIVLNGKAKLDAANNYQADGNIQAKNVSFVEGGHTLRNINLISAVHADAHDVELRGLRLSALGGEFSGDAGLTDFARYHLDGNLRGFDLRQLMRQTMPKEQLPYDGVISGAVNVTGDVKTPGLKSLAATTHLSITPGRFGIPVSGRINADYRGSNDHIALVDSYVALPHSRLTLSGAVDRQLNVSLTSTDLNDFLAAFPTEASKIPVQLNRGKVSFNGTVTGRLTAPQISGHLAANRLSVEGRQFDSLQADLAASKSRATIDNGSITRAGMQATFGGAVGMRDWSPTPSQPLLASLQLRNGDLADLVALAGQPPAGYAGTLTADAQITGTVGDPQGSASIQGANGMLDGQPFDQLQAHVNLNDQLVTIPAAYLTSGSARIDLSGQFQHPRDSFTRGHLQAHVQTNQVNLAQVKPLQNEMPNTSGTIQINADVTGNLATTFLLSGVSGNVALRGFRVEGQNYGDLTANATTAGQTVSYQANSDFAGSSVRVNGNTQLAPNYPTTANATIRNLQIAPVLTLAHQSSLPARGVLSADAHFTGTIANPQGDADFDLASARIYDEPLDHVRGKITYLTNAVYVQQLQASAGPSWINLTARYDHPAGNFQTGQLQFNVNSDQINLARIQNVQHLRPGLNGQLQISADGTANVRNGSPRILFSSLNANISANRIAAEGKNFGDLTFKANTAAANRLNFSLQSDLAGSSIDGNGSATLAGDYPVNAQLTLKNVTWSKLQPLIGTSGAASSFEGALDGQVTVNGPVLDTNRLSGALTLSRLSVTSAPRPGSGLRPVGIQNDGPIQVTLSSGIVRLASIKLTGPNTTIQAAGTASLPAQNLNVTVDADADLRLLQNFSQDIDSSGKIVVATTVRGPFTKPLVNGTLELQRAQLHYASFANGISNANGTVVFNGNSASIRNLTAETGGGNLSASGFVSYSDRIRFGLRANAKNARILIQQGVSVVTDADIRLTGTTENSLVSGNVTIDTLNYSPQSDIGSMLSVAGPPVQETTVTSPMLVGMRLDIRVRTSPALAVQASLAQNLQADADLRIRGTAAQPGVLGRITISEGKLVFFGSTYTVNSGNIGFYNPVRIDPVLDVSLETQAKGVDVVLHVTGPIDNMKLSYTSDPPLQFQEIIGLLAAGRTPTSDPTLLANQPAEPQQTFQQMGESALLDQAIANPVSSRLQRVFGVTQLKIDPTFIEGSQLPTARLSLQQQITSNITFTYVSALNDPNTTVIRVEWAFSQQWSAVATRDENGIFSVNFFYKKQFR